MTNVNAQVFFASRATARSTSFGKMTDNGSTAPKRWARTVELSGNGDKTMSVAKGVRKNGYKAVQVVTKKMKTLVEEI